MEQPCKVCQGTHITGMCTEGETGLSKELVGRILRLDKGESLLYFLQTALRFLPHGSL